MTNKKVWFITGASRGMGVDFAKAVLAADHAVVASGGTRTACPRRWESRIICWQPSWTTDLKVFKWLTPFAEPRTKPPLCCGIPFSDSDPSLRFGIAEKARSERKRQSATQ